LSAELLPEVPLNVLLLLSYDQEPNPDEELLALEEACKNTRDGEVYFATTRDLSSLRDGGEVAFHGDGRDEHRLLATATFRAFIPFESKKAVSILANDRLYGTRHPRRLRGFVRLSQLQNLRAGTLVDSLGGWLSDGQRLTTSRVPSGHARASVYYVKGTGSRGPALEDRLRLSQAKAAELEDKYADTRRLWDEDVARQQRRHKLEMVELEALIDAEIQAAPPSRPGGRAGNLANLLALWYEALFPSLRLLPGSAEALLEDYTHSRSFSQAFKHLNEDPTLRTPLRGSKALAAASGWFRARLGNDLGRLYYRSVRTGRDFRVDVLVSQKDEQDRTVLYLRSLKD